MKKIVFIVTIALLGMTGAAQAQPGASRAAQVAQAKSELKAKASKEARKEAKRFTKEGWKTTPGSIPLEKQIDREFVMKYEYADDGETPKYIFGEGNAVGQVYDAAKMQARELAVLNIASELHKDVTEVTSTSLGNAQLPQEEATSIANTMQTAKSFVSQSLGRTIPVTEIYQKLPNGNFRVLVHLAYNYEKFDKAKVLEHVRQQLLNEGAELSEKTQKWFEDEVDKYKNSK